MEILILSCGLLCLVGGLTSVNVQLGAFRLDAIKSPIVRIALVLLGFILLSIEAGIRLWPIVKPFVTSEVSMVSVLQNETDIDEPSSYIRATFVFLPQIYTEGTLDKFDHRDQRLTLLKFPMPIKIHMVLRKGGIFASDWRQEFDCTVVLQPFHSGRYNLQVIMKPLQDTPDTPAKIDCYAFAP